MKDLAFLFCSKEFYEETRTMYPEERACYMDLLIYQLQHDGIIPDDTKRLLLYCTGVGEATLEAVLKAKFKRCDGGWYDEALMSVMNARRDYLKKQSINGVIGQFFKKITAKHGRKFADKVRLYLKNATKEDVYSFVKSLESIDKQSVITALKAKFQGSVKHLANEDTTVEDETTAFETVWALYDKKGNKKTSQRRWKGLSQKSKDLAVKHIPLYVASTPEIRYRKNFETYISQEAWNDEIISVATRKPPEPPKSRIQEAYDTLQQAKQMLRNEQPIDNSD